MRVFPYQKPKKKREAERQTITEINVETRTTTTYDYYAHLTVAKQACSWSRALFPSPTFPLGATAAAVKNQNNRRASSLGANQRARSLTRRSNDATTRRRAEPTRTRSRSRTKRSSRIGQAAAQRIKGRARWQLASVTRGLSKWKDQVKHLISVI